MYTFHYHIPNATKEKSKTAEKNKAKLLIKKWEDCKDGIYHENEESNKLSLNVHTKKLYSLAVIKMEKHSCVYLGHI